MKRCGLVALTVMILSSGCVTLPQTIKPSITAEKPEAVKPKRPTAVTAEQTTEGNAHEIVQALQQELERDGSFEK